MTSNVTDAVPQCEARIDLEADAFDALPATVRQALAASTVKWSALDVHTEYAPELSEGDHAAIVRAIHAAEAWEREVFATAYLRRWKHELPHLAASATPLRSMPPPAVQSARRMAL